MEFTLTTWLEKQGMDNIFVVEVLGTEPFVVGPAVATGLKDTYDSWEIEGDCDANGQMASRTDINLGPVNCGDHIPVGASVTVTIKKNGTENSKESQKVFEGSAVCQ